ncbi:Uma2 family endonuclease [Candidatus Cyanaurora vandensis]|uniref:Uma2 family endonuclease n=1 Tax=Candidatus Cyanaurora vandensis TaxID=2714958 RepID=UPI00257DBA4A|nr:Uma2 family endonuclease [Candidatus Cyanaurora vandensis]
MTTQMNSVCWTTADLELLPDNGTRYEIIDGELFMTRAPHWDHQEACLSVGAALRAWSKETGLGRTTINPGVIFSDTDAVIPDVVWASQARLALVLDTSGHLTAAPELVVEVLSLGVEHERRDRVTKLKLYSVRGVQEYWLADWRLQRVEIYRREQAVLVLAGTLLTGDTLTSPLLPGFTCLATSLFT